MAGLIEQDGRGLRCGAGGFHVDPWKPVPLAVITHAHADHARPGMGRYVCAAESEPILRLRIGRDADITPLEYAQPLDLGRTRVSLHPAGHCLGSAQVRIEAAGGGGERVAVVAGDYKRAPDPSCEPFEPVECDVFVTEATFALPIYRWRDARTVAAEMLAWWRDAAVRGQTCVLLTYALGKAQRVLAELRAAVETGEAVPEGTPLADGLPEVLTHGAVEPLVRIYRDAGRPMLPTRPVGEIEKPRGENPFAGRLVIAPPSAAGSPWMRRFGRPADVCTGFVSGWMAVRGVRRRRGYDTGFVMSDHADWPDLIRTCRQSGAGRVLCTHGSSTTLARYLREAEGIDAEPLETPYAGEAAEDEAAVSAPGENGPEHTGEPEGDLA